jgi:hypothetical protein
MWINYDEEPKNGWERKVCDFKSAFVLGIKND